MKVRDKLVMKGTMALIEHGPITSSIESQVAFVVDYVLEHGVGQLAAERDLYEMMAHDLAPEPLVERITKLFPAIAEQWRDYRP